MQVELVCSNTYRSLNPIDSYSIEIRVLIDGVAYGRREEGVPSHAVGPMKKRMVRDITDSATRNLLLAKLEELI